MGVNSLPKTVTRQRLPGPSAPESNTLTTRLPSHPEVEEERYSDLHLVSSNITMSMHLLTLLA